VTPVDAVVRARIERHGPIPFDEVMAAALYDPEAGFYTTGGQAGRRGDFITSPEVGPLFGEVVARALDAWWDAAGRPETFVVAEAGAGPGTLARSVLRASPACGRALRYVLVETSPAQRALHAEHLPLEEAVAAFPTPPDPDSERPVVSPPPGPIVVSLPELPRLDGPCVVLANELLDNLPIGIAERTPAGWAEVRVGLEGDQLVEVLLPRAGRATRRGGP
jgi:SAM-dependent MidA family methyltransferase